MKKIALTMIFAGATLMAADGAALYAKCAGCHGADGKTRLWVSPRSSQAWMQPLWSTIWRAIRPAP